MFWNKKEETAPKDFSSLNHLSAEVKLLIVNGQTLVDEAADTLKDKTYYFDLTSKNQLKTDIKKVEKTIKLISAGKTDEKTVKQLEVSTICLQTTLDGLRQFFGRE